MKNITELLKDKEFVAGLLNGPCQPRSSEKDFTPITSDWIENEASEIVTAAFKRLLPKGLPYTNYVVVERNPDTICDGTAVDENKKRTRYFLITIITDTDTPYNYSFPLIHQMSTFSLACWEMARAVLAANSLNFMIKIDNYPKPPILNNAIINWVTLYLGRKPYAGCKKVSEQWIGNEDYDGVDTDIKMYEVRNMEKNDVLEMLIEAYDKDCPETPAK